MKIDGAVVLVTGGASGMGAAVAEHLAGQGAKPCLLDLNAEALQVQAEKCKGVAFACDVTDAAAVEKAVDECVSKVGVPRVAINCAGIAPGARIVGREGPMPLDAFNQVIQINLCGTFNVMRVVAAAMLQADPVGDDEERGVIINTASVAAYEGQIGQAAYSASKGGIVSMTLPAARELASWGVRVMTIAPGVIATPMMAGMPEKVEQSLIAQTVYPKRLGHAKEYAMLAQQIIENPMLNGRVIRLDGALTMGAK